MSAQNEGIEIELFKNHQLIDYPTKDSTYNFSIPLRITNHNKVPVFLPNLLQTWQWGEAMVDKPCELLHPSGTGMLLTSKKGSQIIGDQLMYNEERWYSDVSDTNVRYVKDRIEAFQRSVLIGPGESIMVDLNIKYQAILNDLLGLNEYSDNRFDLDLTYRSKIDYVYFSDNLYKLLREYYHARIYSGCIDVGAITLELSDKD